jgi:hypothetical protein
MYETDLSGSLIFIQSNCIYFKQITEELDIIHSKIFPPIQPIWITGDSDIHITESIIEPYQNTYTHWFAMNLEIEDSPNHTLIPIGIDTHCAPNKAEALCRVSKEDIQTQDTPLAFLSINIHTFFCERAIVEVFFKDEPWVTHRYPIEYDEFCREVRRHKFVFCPRGNGYDTIRMWETLYLGSIPIVRENPVVNEFAKWLPICVVKDWSHVNPEYLELEYKRIRSRTDYNFNVLRWSYWREKILSKAQAECAAA